MSADFGLVHPWDQRLIEASERRTLLLRRAEQHARFALEIDDPPRYSTRSERDYCSRCSPRSPIVPEEERLRYCSKCYRLLVDELADDATEKYVTHFEYKPPVTSQDWQALWVTLRTAPDDQLVRVERLLAGVEQ